MVREESVYVVLVRSLLRPKLQKTDMISQILLLFFSV